MTTAEVRKKHDQLPAVLIQHPTKSCAYFLPADQLAAFRATPETFANLNPGTVTFSITSDDELDEVPPFNQDPSDSPDVLVRFLRDRSAYLIPHAQLQRFKVAQPVHAFGEHYVSFIVPAGMELIAEIPFMKRGLLQSNTG